MKNLVMRFVKRFIKSELVSGSFYIMVAGTTGGFLAAIFNFFLVRKITPEEYGIFISLISFSGLITIPSQSITVSIVQYASPFLSKKEIKKASFLYTASLKYIGILSICLFIFFIAFSKFFAGFLHINNIYYLWVAALIISLGYFGIINMAFLQSLLKFKFLAIVGFAGNVTKLVLGVALVLLGFRVYGALATVIVVGLIPIISGFFPLWFIIKSEKEKPVLSKRDVFSYAIAVSIISLSLTSFTSTDVILVKHFFSPTQAGLYSGLSLVGKVIFYLTAPITMVLFPLVIKKMHEGVDFIKTFYLALFLVLVPSVAISLFYFIFPKFTIIFFLGGKSYLTLSPYVGLYSIFLVIFCLLNVTITFLLSLKKTSVVFPMLLGTISQIVCIYLFHKNFFQVIYAGLGVTSILLVAILLYYVRNYESKKTQKTASIILNNPNI